MRDGVQTATGPVRPFTRAAGLDPVSISAYFMESDLGFIPTVLNEGVVDIVLGGVPFFRMCNNEARVAVLA